MAQQFQSGNTGPQMSAGCRSVELQDEVGSRSFRMLVLYPSSAPEQLERLDRFVLPVAKEGPVASGRYPLVVVSHGSGGSHLLYRDLAAHLARNGFIVALPEHPGNNRSDNALAGTHTILADRPRQLRLAIDWVHEDRALAGHLAHGRVAIVGHSLGGYAALAIAGGRPMAGPRETPDGEPRAVPVTPDDRVRALVLLAPATPWFMAPGALEDVRIPILMRTGEKDESTPAWHAELVRRGVPDATRIDHRAVPNAGHYSFLSPFPEELTCPSFLPSQDPPGFDRRRLHGELNAEVTAFLRHAL